jgi:Mg-chelatase subunit ChlD
MGEERTMHEAGRTSRNDTETTGRSGREPGAGAWLAGVADARSAGRSGGPGPGAGAASGSEPQGGATRGIGPVDAGAGGVAGGDERLRRWRLVLGGGPGAEGTGYEPSGQDAAVDRTLSALYGSGGGVPAQARGGERGAGLGGSAPQVARWLGDIRRYFPTSVVQVMQRDAIGRLGLRALLTEPEMLEAVEADVHLVGTLLSLNKAMPETARETARTVVRKVVRDLEERLAARTRTTLTGALDRSARIGRPRHRDIDWDRTIRANLRHYLPEHGTVVPQRLVGYGRADRSVRKDVVLCIDQSGSMAASVVYASVFGAVLASMRSLRTRLVVFDTAVVDLTDQLADPVDVLFGTQLGGGTDINRALAYCQSLITRPADTVVVLVSDLYEGGIRDEMLKRVAAMKASGVQFVALLALSDEGAPAYDREHAAALAALGAPAFACTPDLFPEVMAAAVEKRRIPVPEA